MGQFRTSRTFDVIFLIVVAGFIWWSAIHRVGIGDWIYFLSYDPSPQATQISKDAGLSPVGQKLLFRTNPQIVSREEVEAECDIERIGCISPKGQVFILDDPDNDDQTLVTAAHEMLHLAYRRLSKSEKDKLAPLIDEAVRTNKIKGLEPEARNDRDEAHSILGTEYSELPDELEQYYSKYFTDRSKVLAAQAASKR